ncbi:DUF397 domain-containing protein [Catellatospora sp. NPDC049609]|uniref:DUF397 domain-containing protein n=1 Tax=Catellatospora sp. NPDC049609 TaxID=3155505 RepID=UPI003443E2B7
MWRKSSRSGGNGDCVETTVLTGAVAVRDSKNPAGPVLMFSTADWGSFLAGTKAGEFDR